MSSTKYAIFSLALTPLFNVSVAAQAEGDSAFSFTTIAVVGLLVAGLGALLFLKFKPKGAPETIKFEAAEPAEEPKAQRAERERSSKPPMPSHTADISRGPVSQQPVVVKKESIDISKLPITQFTSVDPPKTLIELEDSDDDGLLAAIDELQDDSEVDAEFRAIALRVLATFRTRNAVEALSQIALYDLSSTLRSKAVSMLADVDHESVFGTIVLACADPSREVRAAGARALVKVTFDRADEWARLAALEDVYLARQIARAAVEAGIAERSFDRLVLKDSKAAYEALALVYLLVKADETATIFDAVRNHRDIKTRIALLHCVKIANVAEVIPGLSEFIAAEPISSPVADKAREVLLGITAAPVGS